MSRVFVSGAYRDRAIVARLAHALMGSPAEAPNAATAAGSPPRPAAPEQHPANRSGPPEPNGSSERRSGLEIVMALVMALSAAGLGYVGLSLRDSRDPSAGTAPAVTTPASTAPGPSGTPTPDTGVPMTDAAVSALLVAVKDAGSPRLPVSSCQAGADAVTCINPAPNISTVVLTPYQTPTELYAAYTAEVESLSSEPMKDNTGDCSTFESEGEVGWNLDNEHPFDFSVAQQANGGLDPASESAGRVFCTDSQKVMSLVWTQDPGLLVTATGQPSELVIAWWSDAHLQLAGPSAAE